MSHFGPEGITPSMFYVGQAMWDDIKNSGKIMGQLISKSKNVWDSEKVGTFTDRGFLQFLPFKGSLYLIQAYFTPLLNLTTHKYTWYTPIYLLMGPKPRY